MEQFDENIKQAIQQSVIKEIRDYSFLNLTYSEKKHIPDHILDNLWGSINWEEVIEELRPRIQTRICNSIIGSMEAELKTDIKLLLSVDGVRQKLRMNVYPQMMKVLNNK